MNNHFKPRALAIGGVILLVGTLIALPSSLTWAEEETTVQLKGVRVSFTIAEKSSFDFLNVNIQYASPGVSQSMSIRVQFPSGTIVADPIAAEKAAIKESIRIMREVADAVEKNP